MTTSSQDQRHRSWLSDEGVKDNIAKRTAAGGAIAMSAQILRIIIQIGSSAILSRLLLPADFGLFAMAMTVSSFVIIFSELGLSSATVQARHLSQDMVSSLLYLSVAVSLVAMVLTIFLSIGAAYFYGDMRVLYLGAFMSISIPIGAAASQHNALLGRQMRWLDINTIMITSQLVGAAVAITLAWLTSFAYWALAFQVLASSITAAILSWLICTWRPSLLFNWQSCRVETRFGLHMTGFSVTNYFHRQMDNVLIGHRWGAQELGFYSRSYNLLLTPISIVNAAIGQVVVPLLSRHQDNSEEWRHYLLVSLAFTCFGCSGISAVLVANADSIVRVVLGPGWDYSAKIFFYLGLSLFAMAPMNAMGWVFMSLGQTDRWFRWGLFTAVIFPITFLIGLPFHAIGVAQAYSVAVTLIAFPCIMYALRKAPASAMDVARTVRAPLIAGFVTVGLLASTGLVDRMHLAPPLALIIGCSLAGLMFLFLALLLLFMDPAQRPQREIFLRLLRAGRGRLLPNHTS